MATYIETLKKPNNQDTIAPRTLSVAVARPNGETVEDAINNVSQEVKRKNRSFIIDYTLTRETMDVSPDSGKQVYYNGVNITNDFINDVYSYQICNAYFTTHNDLIGIYDSSECIAIESVDRHSYELFKRNDIIDGDMIYPTTRQNYPEISLYDYPARIVHYLGGNDVRYCVKIDIIKDDDIVHYSKNDYASDARKSQARTNIGAEKKGYITIGNTEYQVRTSTTDSGANGYITFVLE